MTDHGLLTTSSRREIVFLRHLDSPEDRIDCLDASRLDIEDLVWLEEATLEIAASAGSSTDVRHFAPLVTVPTASEGRGVRRIRVALRWL